MMPNIAKHLQQNTAKRPHVVQIRLSDEDKKRLDELSKKYSVKATRLLYEMFRFSIELHENSEQANKDKS